MKINIQGPANTHARAQRSDVSLYLPPAECSNNAGPAMRRHQSALTLRVCLLPLREFRARLWTQPLPQLAVGDLHVSDNTLQLHAKTHGQHMLAKKSFLGWP